MSAVNQTYTIQSVAAVEQTLKKAQSHLIGLQHPEGYWSFELFVDVLTLCDYLLYLKWHGSLDSKKINQGVKHLLDQQLPDGGWSLYYGGPSEINLTVKGYLVLKLAGYAINDPLMTKIRNTIKRLGGVKKMNTYSKLMLALLGLVPWESLPCIPAEIMHCPNWFTFNIYELSSWSRNMVVPLTIIDHFKPVRALPPEYRIDELFENEEDKKLSLEWDNKVFSARNFFLFLDKFLKLYELLPATAIRTKAIKKAEAWILERISDGSDGMGAIFPAMVYTLIALECLGYNESHPLFKKELQDLQAFEIYDAENQSLRLRPCFSPTWDTAISIIALVKSGIPADHPAIVKAADWLISKEIKRFGDWHIKNPYPEASGWAFEFNNEFYPDVDDTAMVLLALRLAKSSNPTNQKRVIETATKWLMSFQCKEGGFAAFDKDVTKPWLEKIPFADHNAILDPPCSCITGRVLELFGNQGFSYNHPVVSKTIRFLNSIQEADGSWFGRWGVNYIYGTWQALRGLHAIGVDLSKPQYIQARDWLESCQNSDGGWGETAESYENPALKGKGPSSPTQTAWAVMGLLAFGDPSRNSILRGINYLISTQNPDGSWTETVTNGTGFPKVYYLRYDSYRLGWPILALAEYLELVKSKN